MLPQYPASHPLHSKRCACLRKRLCQRQKPPLSVRPSHSCGVCSREDSRAVRMGHLRPAATASIIPIWRHGMLTNLPSSAYVPSVRVPSLHVT